MQPYVNPMYFQQYPQYQNPSMQYSGYNQPQQMVESLNGKMVDSIDQITPNDVPMNGSVAIFPKRDMSEMYVRRWNTNGTISTTLYVPKLDEIEPQAETSTNEDLKSLILAFNEFRDTSLAELDNIKKQLSKAKKNEQ